MKLKKSQYNKLFLVLSIIVVIAFGLTIIQTFYLKKLNKDQEPISQKISDIAQAGGFDKITQDLNLLNNRFTELMDEKNRIISENPDLSKQLQELKKSYEEAQAYNAILLKETSGDYESALEKYNSLEKDYTILEGKIKRLKDKYEK